MKSIIRSSSWIVPSLILVFQVCSRLQEASSEIISITQTNLVVSANQTGSSSSSSVDSILSSILANQTLLSRLWNQNQNSGSELHQSVINLLNLTIIIHQHLTPTEQSTQELVAPFEPDYTPTFPPLTSILVNNSDPESEKRRRFVRTMAMEAWSAYTKYAWGQEALKPLTGDQEGGQRAFPLTGETILAAASTLWLMGEREEFAKAKKWIAQDLNVTDLKAKVETQRIVSGYIGALLSCYALTGDEMFSEKAREIVDAITTTTDPGNLIPGSSGNGNGHGSNGNGAKSQSAASSLHEKLFQKMKEITVFPNQRLEYRYLTDLTGDQKYANLIAKNEDLARAAGLSNSNSLASQSLLMKEVKAYIQLRRTDPEGLALYNDTIGKALQEQGAGPFILSTKSNMTFVQRDVLGKMHFADCNFGSMLALGAEARKRIAESIGTGKPASWIEAQQSTAARHQQLAEQITDTCRRAISATRIDLPPMSFAIPADSGNGTVITGYGSFALMPNIAESYFVLWRTTRNRKYRRLAWQLVQQIAKHCKADATGGYAQIHNVNEEKTNKKDYQPPYFMAATLKYLYLIFAPLDYVPLDEWVFNSAGHPLPICGRNGAYSEAKCGKTKR